MTRTQLEILSLLAMEGSFTTVAKRLGVSQSAVSQALKTLETELSVSLFVRNGAVMEMTEIGASILPKAREILGLRDAILEDAASFQGNRSGSLRIGSFGPTSTIRLLPPILDRFHERHPHIEVRIDEGSDDDVVHWLQERRVDVGFVTLPNDDLATIPIAEDQLVAILPQNSPLAAKKAVSAADLADHPFVMTEAGSGRHVEQFFAAARVSPIVRCHTMQIASALSSVQRGMGVTILAELALPKDIDAMDVHVRPLDPRQVRNIALAQPSRGYISPAVEAFMKIAKVTKTAKSLH